MTDDDAVAGAASDTDLWERHAQWWIDGFSGGADPEYDEQILPLAAAELAGATRVLDVGCGEGQLSRLAARLDGIELVVGVDPTWNQISVAVQRGGAHFARAAAHELPFPDEMFDAVVACLVFEHIDEVDSLVSGWSSKLTKQEIADKLNAAGVPSAPVRELEEVVNDPHLRQRGMLREIDHPDAGPLVVPHTPIRVGDWYADLVPSPRLGQHNDEIYGDWLGVDADTLEDLKVRGVI